MSNDGSHRLLIMTVRDHEGHFTPAAENLLSSYDTIVHSAFTIQHLGYEHDSIWRLGCRQCEEVSIPMGRMILLEDAPWSILNCTH